MLKESFIFITFFITFAYSAYSNTKQVEQYPKAGYKEGVISGKIRNKKLKEISGIVASQKNPNTLWVINDSGDQANLYAINNKGKLIKTFKINNVQNRDFEDMSTYKYNNKAFLVIADIGDNKARYNTLYLHFIEEPLFKQSITKTQSLTVAHTLKYTYEDGPKDSESLAIDSKTHTAYILSKRTAKPLLYKLPIDFSKKETHVAKKIAAISNLIQPNSADLSHRYGKYNSQPTSMSLNQAGNKLVILTYHYAYLYHKHEKQSWHDAFSTSPQILNLPHPSLKLLRQREAICFDLENNIFVTSEKLPAPLYLYRKQ